MSNNYRHSGESMTFTAPSGGVVSGVGLMIGQLYVVPTSSAAEGALFGGMVTGVHASQAKATGEAWAEGALIYFDGTECTTTATSADLIGCAAEAAGSAATTGVVRLNGTARPTESA